MIQEWDSAAPEPKPVPFGEAPGSLEQSRQVPPEFGTALTCFSVPFWNAAVTS